MLTNDFPSSAVTFLAISSALPWINSANSPSLVFNPLTSVFKLSILPSLVVTLVVKPSIEELIFEIALARVVLSAVKSSLNFEISWVFWLILLESSAAPVLSAEI